MGAPNLDAGEVVLAAVAAQSVPEVSLHTWAWEPISEGIAALIGGPDQAEVDNLEVEGIGGRYPFAPILDQGIYRVPMIIVGSHEPDGTPYDDHKVGLRRNVVLFRQQVCPLIDTPTGVRQLTYSSVDPEEAAIIADVQVLPFQVQDASPTAWEIALPIYVPDGGLIEAGS